MENKQKLVLEVFSLSLTIFFKLSDKNLLVKLAVVV